MVDQEQKPDKTVELGRQAKERTLKAARSSGFFDSRNTDVLTYREVPTEYGDFVAIPASMLSFNGIYNIEYPGFEPNGMPNGVAEVTEIPLAEYIDYETIVAKHVQIDSE